MKQHFMHGIMPYSRDSGDYLPFEDKFAINEKTDVLHGLSQYLSQPKICIQSSKVVKLGHEHNVISRLLLKRSYNL